MIKEIYTLLEKDLKNEWKSKQAISGALLYLFSTMLVLYYSLVRVEKFMWTGVLWILLIFLSINAVSSSFSNDIRHRHWYYYSLVHPLSIYFSKLIFNIILLIGLGVISLLLFNIFFTIPVTHWMMFGITLIISIIGIASIFTFIALLSAKASNQTTLMTILSTPLIFPILMSGSRLCLNAIGILKDTGYAKDVLSIVSIDVLAISLSIILFPILWRD